MTGRGRSRLHALISLFAEVRADEGHHALKLMLRIFLVLFAYYLLKPTREALILHDGSAELRSYAMAAQAGVLLVLLPLYGRLVHHTVGELLYTRVTLFFVANLAVFYFLGRADYPIGFAFFVWLGIFSIAQVAQFWALAADIHSVESGQRLFGFIAVGGSLGALIGSQVAKFLFAFLDPFSLMLLAAAVLLMSLLIGGDIYEKKRVESALDLRELVSSFDVVLHSPYLRVVALLVVLLNCINSTGEYILAKFVLESLSAAGHSDTQALIGRFYSDFFFWVNTLSLLFQLFLVSRLYRHVGVRGALLVLPLIAAVGYTAILLFPLLAFVKFVKILENSADYSIQNTTRHTLFLPLDVHEKYLGKTIIDTFFWRLGDLLQGGLVFVGTAWLSLGIKEFAGMNLLLSLAWLAVALRIGKRYQALCDAGEGCGVAHRQEDGSRPVEGRAQPD